MSPFIADVCVPKGCGELDVQNIVQLFVNEHSWGNMSFTVTDSSCYKGRRIRGDPAALFSMTLLLALASCVGLGTAYDIFLRRRKLRAKSGLEYLIGYQKETKQYGILKVILAPPSSKKLRRRATVGGYERSSHYTLSEMKVDRKEGSVYERQLSDVSEDDSVFAAEGVGPGHPLYDIPEEETKMMDGQNGHAKNKLTPEIVYKPRPVEKGGICWIVLGNVYMVLYLNPGVVDNHVDGVKLTQTFGGTLGAYNFMKLKKDCKGKKMTEVMTVKEYFMLIFHRLVRIGPCYLIIIMMFTNLMPYMGRGPRWTYEKQSVRTCKDHWWANVLFISNFYKADDMCMPHTFYLVNDFQFGLLMPFIMVPMLCMPIVGFVLLGVLVMTQIVSTLILDEGINGNVLRMAKNDYFSRIYVKPYCRVGVYAIGLGLGYLLYVTKRQVNFKRVPLTIFWALSLLVICTLPYITYAENKQGGREWSGIQTAMFEALSRPLWGLALSWVIFACSTGQGAFVNKLLSWNAFLPLCRITYGVYLLHPMLIAIVIGSRHNGFYLDFGALVS
nr:hypothetical protein BaRGS_017161 [Batillaria attramentaria]